MMNDILDLLVDESPIFDTGSLGRVEGSCMFSKKPKESLTQHKLDLWAN